MTRLLELGGAEGTRTPDPHTASVVRYQLRHSPNFRPKSVRTCSGGWAERQCYTPANTGIAAVQAEHPSLTNPIVPVVHRPSICDTPHTKPPEFREFQR